MRNILLSLIFVIISVTSVFSQNIDYPKFEVDSLGQKVVVMTIEQAQALDNSTDLLPLFNKLNGQIGSVDSVCLKVVDDKNRVIEKQQIQINDQRRLISVKDQEISNLQARVNEYINNERIMRQIIDNKDSEIKLHLEKINHQKTKMIIGGGIGGISILGLILGIILIK